MKIATIVVLVFLAVLSTFVAYRYSQSSMQVKQTLDQERFNRLTIEENLSKASARVKELEDQISKVEKKMASMQVVLDNTNAMNDDLKSRLDKAMVIKENMDNKIEELQQMVGGTAGEAQAAVEAQPVAEAPLNVTAQ